MPKNYGAYRLEDGRDDANAATFNLRFQDIDNRIAKLEDASSDAKAVIDDLTRFGLARINEALAPAYAQLLAITSVGAFFASTSESTVTIGTGQKTFVLPESDWANFAPSTFMTISSAGEPSAGMSGRLVDYAPATGTLVINVLEAVGAGTFADWELSVGALPDFQHSGRTDNPHSTTASQVGAYTQAQTDAAISAAIDALVGGAPGALDTLEELAAALADDADFAATVAGDIAALKPFAMPFHASGGEAEVSVGLGNDTFLPFGVTITGYVISGDVSTTSTVQVWVDDYGADTPPDVADQIISASLTAQSLKQVTGLNIVVPANKVWRFNVSANNNGKRLSLTIYGTRT